MARIEVEVVGKDVGLISTFEKANQAAAATGKSIDKTSQSFYVAGQKITTSSKNIADQVQKISSSSARLALESQKTSAVLGGSMVKGTNSAAFALTNLGRVAQDAPFGFIGIQNNLNPLLESFQRLKAETGSNGSALKALTSSLIGPAGIGIALSVVSAGILLYQQYQQRAKKVTEETTKSTKEQREEFIKSPYEKAATDLSELTTKVSLARQGFLDKKAVLKEYNEGIGATIGKVNDLDAAETKLVNNGEKYLQLMLLKAKAEFAFKKAAEESYNLALKQDEIDAKKPKVSKDFNINADRSNKQTKETTLNLRELLKTSNQVTPALDGINTKVEQISKNIGERLADESALAGLQKNSAKAVDVVTKAQQEVIDFAKKNGFDLNGVFGIDTKVKPLENLRENLIEGRVGMEDMLGRVNVSLDDFLQDYNKTAGELGTVPLLPIESFKIQSEKFLTDLDKFSQDLYGLSNLAIDNSLMGLGSAIGEAMANGSSAFEAGGKALLGSFGGFLAEYGKLLIKYGAAAVLKGKLDLAALIPGAGIPAGLLAIAAGVALVAAGAAINSFASGGKSKSGNSSSPNTGRKRTPGFASGVTNFQGGMAYVHANELLTNLPTGTNVIPAAKTDRILSGISGGGTFIADSIIRGQDIVISYRRTLQSNGKI